MFQSFMMKTLQGGEAASRRGSKIMDAPVCVLSTECAEP